MAVPQIGPYVYLPSSGPGFKIQINSANPSTGQIIGVYEPQESPQPFPSSPAHIGTYAWVTPQGGQAGVAPFCINFTIAARPSGFPYCLVDMWNGAYTTSNSLLLTGTRAYVTNQGVVQVTNLTPGGPVTFVFGGS